MNEEIRKKIEDARRGAEDEIGFKVTDEFADSVLQQCMRKCKCAGKTEDYLPIMYRFELPLATCFMAMNKASTIMKNIEKEEEKGNVFSLPAVSMSPCLP